MKKKNKNKNLKTTCKGILFLVMEGIVVIYCSLSGTGG